MKQSIIIKISSKMVFIFTQKFLSLLKKNSFMFFKTPGGKFYCGSALELLKQIPSEVVDMVFTDPPYGLGYGEHDKEKEFYDVLPEIYRILQKDAWLIIWWAIKKIPEVINETVKAGFEYRWIIVSYLGKNSTAKSLVGDREWAPILVFSKGNPRVCHRSSDVIFGNYEIPGVNFKPKNPLYKPTLTNLFVLSYFSEPGALVIDPFAGMGSIPLTCELSNRQWLATELEENTFIKAYENFKKNNIQIQEANIKDTLLEQTENTTEKQLKLIE